MIQEFLTRHGYKVKRCNHARDVKGFVRIISSFDIVFTDMQMGEITGLEHPAGNQGKKMDKHPGMADDRIRWMYAGAGNQGRVHGTDSETIPMGSLLQILSGEKEPKQEKEPIQDEHLFRPFPQLTALFNGDVGAVKDILSRFVQSSEKRGKS